MGKKNDKPFVLTDDRPQCNTCDFFKNEAGYYWEPEDGRTAETFEPCCKFMPGPARRVYRSSWCNHWQYTGLVYRQEHQTPHKHATGHAGTHLRIVRFDEQNFVHKLTETDYEQEHKQKRSADKRKEIDRETGKLD